MPSSSPITIPLRNSNAYPTAANVARDDKPETFYNTLKFAQIKYHQHPTEPQVVVQFRGSQPQNQETLVRQELRPSMPPHVEEMTYARHKSPNRTKHGYTEYNTSDLSPKPYTHRPEETTEQSRDWRVNDYSEWNRSRQAIQEGEPVHGQSQSPGDPKYGYVQVAEADGHPPKLNFTPNWPVPLAVDATTIIDTVKDITLNSMVYNGKSHSVESVRLDISTMLFEFTNILHRICDQILDPPHLFHGTDPVPTDLIDTLMCLEDDEWKYLPLWAGGNDDGTGGVFDEADVPNLEKGGFRGGKRGIGNVDGTPAPSTIDSTSSFDDIADDAISTIGRASVSATDGTRTVKSLSDTDSEAGFMRQDELWNEIYDMKHQQSSDVKGKVRAVNGMVNDGPTTADDLDMDMDMDMDDGDESTAVGNGSDIQGEMFGDIDDDDENEEIGGFCK
jgi:hypothetical protein